MKSLSLLLVFENNGFYLLDYFKNMYLQQGCSENFGVSLNGKSVTLYNVSFILGNINIR